MAKKGVKVKELARELGLTSRQLLDRCRDEGFPVQNSITKLNSELERIVRSWFVAGTPAKEQGPGIGGQGEEAFLARAPGP